MGESTAIVIKPEIVKVPRRNKYYELWAISDALPIVDKESDTGWAHIERMERHDGFLLRCALAQYKTGVQVEVDGTRWKFQTRLRYPFSDRRTIFSFRKVYV